MVSRRINQVTRPQGTSVPPKPGSVCNRKVRGYDVMYREGEPLTEAPSEDSTVNVNGLDGGPPRGGCLGRQKEGAESTQDPALTPSVEGPVHRQGVESTQDPEPKILQEDLCGPVCSRL